MTLMLPNLPTWQEVNSDTCYYGMGYFCQQGIMIPWSIHIITFTHVDNPFVLLILSTQLNNFWFLLILAREIPAGIYYYYFSLWYANYSHDVTYQTSRSLQLWEIPLHPNTYTNYPNTCGWLCDANFPNTLTTISDLYPHLGMSFVMLIFPIHQQLSLIVYSLCC